MDETQHTALKPEPVTIKLDPAQHSEMFVVCNPEVDPPDVEFESALDIYEEFPERILPDDPEEDWIGPGPEPEEEMQYVMGLKDEKEYSSSANNHEEFHRDASEINLLTSMKPETHAQPESSSIIRFSVEAETDYTKVLDLPIKSEPRSVVWYGSKSNRPSIFECNFCGNKFTRMTSVNRHIGSVHKGLLRYDCELCGKVFTRRDVMKIHMKNVHERQQPYKFKRCNKKVVMKQLKMQDGINHRKEKPFESPVARLVSEPGESSNLECSFCNCKFTSVKYLNRHICPVLKRLLQCECEWCGKVFSKKNAMEIHIRNVHKRQQPFKCEKLGKKIVQKVNLKMPVESLPRKKKSFESSFLCYASKPDKPSIFECSFCGNKFTKMNSVNRHIRTVHKGLKQYECEWCEKVFSRKDVLNIHVKNVHERQKSFKYESADKKLVNVS